MERTSEYPLAPANGYAKSDMEMESSVNENSKELHNKKRIKYLLYFVGFCIFQTGVIVLMTFTIMKIRTPKFIVRSASFDTFFGTQETNPSFNFTMNVQLGVKNTNFGTFKFDNTEMYLFYRGSPVGQVSVPKSTALWRSTKKINAVVNVNSFNLPANSTLISSDLRNGVLPITAQSNLNGKVKLVQMFKKKKAIKLNCSFEVYTSKLQVNNIACST